MHTLVPGIPSHWHKYACKPSPTGKALAGRSGLEVLSCRLCQLLQAVRMLASWLGSICQGLEAAFFACVGRAAARYERSAGEQVRMCLRDHAWKSVNQVLEWQDAFKSEQPEVCTERPLDGQPGCLG